MSYIGQQLPADVFSGFTTDAFTGDGSATTFTLSKAPFSEDGLIVVINNVIQRPTTNFTVSGTTLTIVGTAVASGDVIYAIHTSGAVPSTLASKVDVNGLSDGVILDADGDTTISADTDDQIDFKVGGTDILSITNSSSDLVISSVSNDKDILFKGQDGGSTITAFTLDMSAGGEAELRNGLTLADGDLTVASGHGINFSATSDATGESSELLDDYEEGDWTIGFSTSSGAMTMNSTYKYGKYTKIGNMVTVTGYAIGAGIGSATSSQGVTMTGLPFAVIGENGAYSGLSVSYGEGMSITAGHSVGGYARINYSTIPLRVWDTTSGGSALLQSELSNTGGIIFSCNYFVS